MSKETSKISINELTGRPDPIWDVLITQKPLIIEGHANPDGIVKPIAVVVPMPDWHVLQALRAACGLRDQLEAPMREEITGRKQSDPSSKLTS
jgi:hypothetical protein